MMGIARSGTLVTMALLFGCEPADITNKDTVTETDADTDTDTDTDTDADADADTDTDTDTDVDPNAAISAIRWELHEDYGSLVYASWYQKDDGDVTIEYNFDDEWVAVPTHAGTTGENQALIVGIPYGTSAEWRLTTAGETFSGSEIITDDLDAAFPTPSLVSGDSSKWLQSGNYYLGSLTESDGNSWSGRNFWTFIIDRQARVVWANPTPDRNWTLFAQVSVSDDHILWDEQTYWSLYDSGEDSTVHRTYLDAEIEEISTPGLQHSFNELPDGTLAWLSAYHGSSYGEALVEKAPGASDSDIEVLWQCTDWPVRGGCASNGQFYVADTDSFLMSFYSNEAIVEVDRQTGANLWWAGAVDDGYSFSPRNAQFSWQHGISYTDTGTLMVSSHSANGNSTIVWEYEVNHDTKTLTEVWQFDPGIYGAYNGDAWRLDNGNTLHTPGTAGRVKEATADKEVVWDVNFSGYRLMGRGELIEDLYSLVSP